MRFIGSNTSNTNSMIKRKWCYTNSLTSYIRSNIWENSIINISQTISVNTSYCTSTTKLIICIYCCRRRYINLIRFSNRNTSYLIKVIVICKYTISNTLNIQNLISSIMYMSYLDDTLSKSCGSSNTNNSKCITYTICRSTINNLNTNNLSCRTNLDVCSSMFTSYGCSNTN